MKEKCKICGYDWIRKNETKKPIQCPRCKRYDWENKIILKSKEVKK